jgi:hypothetical protein
MPYNLNYYDLPDPCHFSLPSTFNADHHLEKTVLLYFTWYSKPSADFQRGVLLKEKLFLTKSISIFLIK